MSPSIWAEAPIVRAMRAETGTRPIQLLTLPPSQEDPTRMSACTFPPQTPRPNGYVHVARGGRGGTRGYLHRMVFEAVNGAIPPNHVVQHTCGNHACVNPAHLVEMSRSELARSRA